DRRKLCAPAGGDRTARRRGARAGSGRGAARGGARPLSVPATGKVAAQFRSLRLPARMDGRGAQAQGQPQARGRRRPAELFVTRTVRPADRAVLHLPSRERMLARIKTSSTTLIQGGLP